MVVLVLDIGLLMILTMVVVRQVQEELEEVQEDLHLLKEQQLQQLLTLDQVEAVEETIRYLLKELLVNLVVLVDQELL